MNADIESERLKGLLVDFILEAWRFSRTSKSVLFKLSEEDRARYKGRCSWFCRKMDEALESVGMRLVEIPTGTAYDPGMAVTPLNIGDFKADEPLQVEQMIEPIMMMGDGSMVRTGTVMLGRVEQ